MRCGIVLGLLACGLALVGGQDSVSDIINAADTVGVPAAESLLSQSSSVTSDLAAKCAQIEAQTGIDLCKGADFGVSHLVGASQLRLS